MLNLAVVGAIAYVLSGFYILRDLASSQPPNANHAPGSGPPGATRASRATRASGTAGCGGSNIGSRVPYLGLAAALATLLQSGPIFLPVLGMVMAMLASLPVAVGTLVYPPGAAPLMAAAATVLLLVHVEEAMVFVFTTAPVGVGAAWLVLKGMNIRRLGLPSLVLAGGIAVLSFGLGIPALGPWLSELQLPLTAAVIMAFSAVYSWFFALVTNKTWMRLEPVFRRHTLH